MKHKQISISSPVDGKIIDLASVNDQVFSEKLMGDGFAVAPINQTIYSPVTGTVIFVAPTNHALGIRTHEGLELILHLGIDTVELEEGAFTLQIKEGDFVEAGHIIGNMNLDMIQTAGKDTTVIMAITNSATIIHTLDVDFNVTQAGEKVANIELNVQTENKKIKKENAHHSLAEQIITHIGGEENIKSVTHCITRLRFYLKNETVADDEAIENLEGIIAVTKAGGQYQIVIGPEVTKVHKAVISQVNVDDNVAVNNHVIDTAEPKNIWQKVKYSLSLLLGVIVGSISPVIGVLAASGIMKGVLALLTGMDFISSTGNAYIIINAMTDSAFYFLPVIIGFTAARHLGADPVVTAIIGGAIAYPTIIEAANEGLNIIVIGSITFPYVSYTYSIFPMIIAAWMVKKLEGRLNNWIPSFIQSIINPVIIISIVTTLTMLVTGPVITWLAFGLADGIQELLSWNTAIFGALINGFYQFLVVFGLHWGFVPLFVNDFATVGQSQLFAIVSITMVGQGGAALAVAVKTTRANLKGLGFASAISAFCGVTEPALYGINLRFRRTFICANIASAVGGLLIGLFDINMWSIAGSIIGLPSFIDPSQGITANFWYAVMITFITLALSFILTYIWGFNDKMVMEEKREKPKNPKHIEKA